MPQVATMPLAEIKIKGGMSFQAKMATFVGANLI
jgi:hypothetical protein